MPLTHRHLHRLHTALRQLHQPITLETFPQIALSTLAEVISADISAYNEVNPQTRQMQVISLPDELRFPDGLNLWLRHMHEHPTLTHLLHTGDGSAHKISDFLTRRQFHHLALYQEVYRRLDGEYQMSMILELPSSQIIAFVFNRARKDFSEPERELLNLLRPHLTQVYLQAEAAMQLQQDMTIMQRAFDALDRGVIVITMNGRLQWITPQAQRWLQKYFTAPPGSLADGLPDAVRQWMLQQCHTSISAEPAPPLRPLVIERAESALSIRCIIEPEMDRLLLLLQEQQRDFCPATLAPLGLSKRECEILYWVMQGKTNPEIGALLGVSPSTVRTRLEDIFSKLGVRTRTAAAMRARELLARLES